MQGRRDGGDRQKTARLFVQNIQDRRRSGRIPRGLWAGDDKVHTGAGRLGRQGVKLVDRAFSKAVRRTGEGEAADGSGARRGPWTTGEWTSEKRPWNRTKVRDRRTRPGPEAWEGKRRGKRYGSIAESWKMQEISDEKRAKTGKPGKTNRKKCKKMRLLYCISKQNVR